MGIRYAIAVGAIASLITISHIAAHRALNVNNEYAAIINMSGRQRMLSQRILLLSRQVIARDDTQMVAARADLTATIALFEQSHDALLSANKSLAAPPFISAVLSDHYAGSDNRAGLDITARAFIAQAREYTDHHATPTLQQWSQLEAVGSAQLLPELDTAVTLFEEAAMAATDRIQRIGIISFILALTILVFEVVLIFIPARRTVITALDDLERKNRRLTRAKSRLETLVVAAKRARRGKTHADAASAAKSRFLAQMSHEIRTPLNGILGMAQALSTKTKDSDVDYYTKIILSSGKSLLSTLNDILDVSKIEAGKVDIKPTASDIRTCMDQMVALWASNAADKGIALSHQIDQHVPHDLVFDPNRVRQCVGNLVSNAVKFTESGSVHLTVGGDHLGSGLWVININVADTGIGISQEAAKRLFRTFEQADHGSTRRFGGTGLGLSIARDLARLMGGDVTVRSALGVGSTFTLTFTAQEVDHRAPTVSEPRGKSELPCGALQDKRVLLVDDDIVNRKVINALLENCVATIVEAENGQQALDLLTRAGPFDVVLLDKHMPVLDGPQTVARIRAAETPWRTIPIVGVTADAMAGERERLLALGMDGYVSKPVSRDELVAEALRVLAKDKEAAPAAGGSASPPEKQSSLK